MDEQVGWLNLFPSEMRPGDVLGEGMEIERIYQEAHTMTWTIHMRDRCPSICIYGWPDRAPRRLYRPGPTTVPPSTGRDQADA